MANMKIWATKQESSKPASLKQKSKNHSTLCHRMGTAATLCHLIWHEKHIFYQRQRNHANWAK